MPKQTKEIRIELNPFHWIGWLAGRLMRTVLEVLLFCFLAAMLYTFFVK